MAQQMQITFRLLDAADLEFYRSWFNDAELARRLSYPTDDWFAYVAATDASRCWVALDENGGMIAALLHCRPGADFAVLKGAIEPDNAASLACVRRCGFEILPGLDEDGLVRVRRDREEVDL